MGYRLAADALVLAHGAFILFAVFGGLLALRWRWLALLHLPAAAWAVLVEAAGWICPLTPLEVSLRIAAGQAGYQGGFVEHYLVPVIYPAGLTRGLQFALAAFVLAVNAGVYAAFVRCRLKRPPNRTQGTSEPARP